MSNSIVVYTAISNGYDILKDPEFIDDKIDYICYTDSEHLYSNVWQIRKMDATELDSNRKAKYYKIFPHKHLLDYDISLWVDGNFKIVGNIETYINTYLLDTDIACMIHPRRNCIYDEAKACIRSKKDSADIINTQMSKYRNNGYPEQNGLVALSILLRRHKSERLAILMEAWWKEIVNHSKRDQLSFNYLCWKYRINYDQCDLPWLANEYFVRTEHANPQYTQGSKEKQTNAIAP